MHNDPTMRGTTRLTRTRATYLKTARATLFFAAAAALTACADETPTQPKANMPEGGPKSVAMAWGLPILPTNQTFPQKIAFVTGSANGQLPYVQVYDKSGAQMARFRAFDENPTLANGVDATVGDVNGDGWPDIIVGEGAVNFGPYHARFSVWDGRTGAWISGLGIGLTYRSDYRVGAGDVDGDGRDEIFLCTGPTSTEPARYSVMRYEPSITAPGSVPFSFVIGQETLGSLAGKNSYNGCRVAGGDVDGDGKDELIAAFEGPANTLVVRNIAKNTNLARSNALNAGYMGGISVAAADVTGDKKAEIFLGRLTGLDKLPPVFMYNGAAVLMNSTLPTPAIMYPITNSISNTGVYIAARDLSGDGIPELLAKMSTTGGPSTYVARMGPTFTTLWLNRTEPGSLRSGGPIG